MEIDPFYFMVITAGVMFIPMAAVYYLLTPSSTTRGPIGGLIAGIASVLTHVTALWGRVVG